MTEQSPAATSADFASLRDHLQASIVNPMAELAAQLRPGVSVRVLPSDTVEFSTTQAMPGTTALVVGAQEDRTSVTLIAGAAGVWLSSRVGQVPGASNTAQLVAGVPVTIPSRSAIYAAAAGSDPIDLTIILQSARYTW